MFAKLTKIPKDPFLMYLRDLRSFAVFVKSP